jgi:hypothetical protein
VLEHHAGHVSAIRSVEEALEWDSWARHEARGTYVAVGR